MTKAITIPRLVIAGTASGVGKTTVTAGLIGALRQRGLKVASFKCGPDYLDPTYHKRAAGGSAAGAVCHNLDGWIMGHDAVLQTFARATEGADIALIEGVMGLFDGASPQSDVGSTAQTAKWLSAPVVLVVDASGMARSLAAVALGFATFDPALHLVGVVANRVGSSSHTDLLKAASTMLPVFGGLPKRPDLGFPERYLGLQAARDDATNDDLFAAWGALVASSLDIDALLAVANAAPAVPWPSPSEGPDLAEVCRIGVAMDQGFDFYYEDNLRRLTSLGARIVPFSPMHDRELPAVDGLYFGGGYPESVAAALSHNAPMLAAVRQFAAADGPIYAECGGLLYLCSALQTLTGERFPMVGLIPGEAVMKDKLQALGYVEVETQQPSIIGEAGVRFRGHQFRYSLLEVDDATIGRAYALRQRRNNTVTREGYCAKNVLASYVHAHWASNPMVASNLVASCVRYKRGLPC